MVSDELTAGDQFDARAVVAPRPVGEPSAAAPADEYATDEPDADFGIDDMFQTIMI